MNSEQRHTLEVDIDEIGAALEPTRMLRLSLEVLWGVSAARHGHGRQQ
jgi:hypothetical protein